MTEVHRLITPAGSNMLCAVSSAEERQACPVTESGFLHWCDVGLNSRRKNSTGRSSYVVPDGMC